MAPTPLTTLTPDNIKAIAGSTAKDSIVDPLCSAMPTMLPVYHLNEPRRLAHFVSQIAHESARFKTTQEYASGRAYEGRKDLGNVNTGDGPKYKGHGLIQCTGRNNHAKFTDWCQLNRIESPDFEEKPLELTKFPWALLVSCWYWDFGNPTGKTLNLYADVNNIEMITRRINGGLNGYQDRINLYTRTGLVLLGYPMKTGVIKQFQTDVGLEPDDIAGPQTRAMLHKQLSAVPPFWVTPDVTPPVTPEVTLEMIYEVLKSIEKKLG